MQAVIDEEAVKLTSADPAFFPEDGKLYELSARQTNETETIFAARCAGILDCGLGTKTNRSLSP